MGHTAQKSKAKFSLKSQRLLLATQSLRPSVLRERARSIFHRVLTSPDPLEVH